MGDVDSSSPFAPPLHDDAMATTPRPTTRPSTKYSYNYTIYYIVCNDVDISPIGVEPHVAEATRSLLNQPLMIMTRLTTPLIPITWWWILGVNVRCCPLGRDHVRNMGGVRGGGLLAVNSLSLPLAVDDRVLLVERYRENWHGWTLLEVYNSWEYRYSALLFCAHHTHDCVLLYLCMHSSVPQ